MAKPPEDDAAVSVLESYGMLKKRAAELQAKLGEMDRIKYELECIDRMLDAATPKKAVGP